MSVIGAFSSTAPSPQPRTTVPPESVHGARPDAAAFRQTVRASVELRVLPAAGYSRFPVGSPGCALEDGLPFPGPLAHVPTPWSSPAPVVRTGSRYTAPHADVDVDPWSAMRRVPPVTPMRLFRNVPAALALRSGTIPEHLLQALQRRRGQARHLVSASTLLTRRLLPVRKERGCTTRYRRRARPSHSAWGGVGSRQEAEGKVHSLSA